MTQWLIIASYRNFGMLRDEKLNYLVDDAHIQLSWAKGDEPLFTGYED